MWSLISFLILYEGCLNNLYCKISIYILLNCPYIVMPEKIRLILKNLRTDL